MYQVRFGKNRYWMYQQKNRLYVKQSKKDNELLNCYGTMDGRMHFEKSIEDSQLYKVLQKQLKKLVHQSFYKFQQVQENMQIKLI